MKKFKVKFVRYDMSKTRNRKRNDMLVDGKSERFVKIQLEKIHKGETVVAIHEITWDEEQNEEVLRLDQEETQEYFTGVVKFFNSTKGFGFIRPDDDMDDLFFHKTSCKLDEPRDNDQVEFRISDGPKGPVATHIRVIEYYE